MTRYRISHRTNYRYDDVVTSSYGLLHQLPGDQDGQRCLSRTLELDPAPDDLRERVDYFGNTAAFFAVHRPHRELTVHSRSVVDTGDRPTDFGDAGSRPWEELRDRLLSRAAASDRIAAGFTLDSPLVARSDALVRYAAACFGPGRPVGEAVLELTHRVHVDFDYDPEATTVETTLDEVLELRAGVCQDFTHLVVGALRSVGLAAAYVSGYVETEPPAGTERLQGADQTHAWVAVYLGERWIGVDPTNDQVAGSRYITTAHGRDYSDVPPLKGVIYTNAIEADLHVEVDVVPASPGGG